MKKILKKLTGIIILLIFTLTFISCGGGGGGGGEATVIIDDSPLTSTSNFILRAEAGPNQSVSVGDSVVLNGSYSTVPKGKLITYQWFFDSIPNNSDTELSNNAVVNPTFIPNAPGQYKVRLIVNDGTTNSEADEIIITATIGNRIPIANAGDNKNVPSKETVALDGSESYDPDGDKISFQWSLSSVPKGSTAQLTGDKLAHPTFKPDIDGAYVVSLIVNDGDLSSSLSTVTIISSSGNSAPIAHAGLDQEILTGTEVTLNGTRSYDINTLDELSYSWFFISVPNGSSAKISDSTIINPSFIPNVSGAYVVSLIVNDGSKDSRVDSVTIVASEENTPPVAITDLEVRTSIGSNRILDASRSKDDDGDTLSYSWSLIDTPLNSTAYIADSSSKKALFNADLEGNYLLSLRVFDGKQFSDAQYIELTALTSVEQSNAFFSESFENGLGQWFADNGVWELGEPTADPHSAYLDNNAVGTILNSNYPDNTDSKFISPSIILPDISAREEIHLRFWHWFNFGSCQDFNYIEEDYGKLEISKQISPGVWGDWDTLATYKNSSGNWTNAFADLSGYAGEKVRIGFLLDNEAVVSIRANPYVACPTSVSSGWYFDEVMIEKIAL